MSSLLKNLNAIKSHEFFENNEDSFGFGHFFTATGYHDKKSGPC